MTLSASSGELPYVKLSARHIARRTSRQCCASALLLPAPVECYFPTKTSWISITLYLCYLLLRSVKTLCQFCDNGAVFIPHPCEEPSLPRGSPRLTQHAKKNQIGFACAGATPCPAAHAGRAVRPAGHGYLRPDGCPLDRRRPGGVQDRKRQPYHDRPGDTGSGARPGMQRLLAAAGARLCFGNGTRGSGKVKMPTLDAFACAGTFIFASCCLGIVAVLGLPVLTSLL